MDSDSWLCLSSNSSRRFHSRSDMYMYDVGGEECYEDGEEESRPEFLCPFCAESFDIVGLCCHVDEEHAVESKNGVCPVCAKRVGIDLIDHVTMQHGNLLKVQRKRRCRRGGPNSNFSISRKELRGGSFQSLLNGSSSSVSSNFQADPLLSLFICNPPEADEMPIVQSLSTEKFHKEDGSAADMSDSGRKMDHPLLSGKDHEEKAQKCEFVQGLVLSTILDDDLYE